MNLLTPGGFPGLKKRDLGHPHFSGSSAVDANGWRRLRFCRQDRPHLRHAFLMAVDAAYPMDVVLAASAGEGGVHFFDVNAAVRHLRMACFAGCPRVFIVSDVAGEAADPFMHALGSAIVA